MTLKLLAVGDMHLGRRASRLPAALAGESRELGPAGAWQRLVEQAIEHGVHAVALAGDVVEREDDFYEAYRELSQGLERLTSAGIRTVGIAGNHDVQVLPRLADRMPEFQLIGRDGCWERVPFEHDGERLTLHGWSFPARQVQRSPLQGVSLERGAGINLGLLHCDRDQPGSPYGPVTSRELEQAGLDGWLLGHIHAPDALDSARPSGYLGSITGMDPSEDGDHGPWLFSIANGQLQHVEQWVLAPLRWQTVELDLGTLEAAADVQGLLLTQLQQLDRDLAANLRPPRAVGIRLRLNGRTTLGSAAEDLLHQHRESGETILDGDSGARYFIERCINATRPPISLEQLAQRSDPAGLLAQRLLLLDRPDTPAARQLIDQGRQRLERQAQDSRWQVLAAPPLDDAAVADWLQRAGTRLLEEMLEQRGDT